MVDPYPQTDQAYQEQDVDQLAGESVFALDTVSDKFEVSLVTHRTCCTNKSFIALGSGIFIPSQAAESIEVPAEKGRLSGSAKRRRPAGWDTVLACHELAVIDATVVCQAWGCR